MRRFNNGFGAFGMRIGYKQLAEIVIVDHLNDLAHARFIELVENIVEQQNRFFARFFFDKIELCEL